MPMRNPAPPHTGAAGARSPAWPSRALRLLSSHALGLRLFGGFLPAVALIDVSQLHRLSGHFLHGLGQLADVLSLLLVSRADSQGEQVPQGIHGRVNLRALLSFGPVVAAPRTALRGGAQGTRVDNRGRRIGGSACRKAQQYAQVVDHRLEHPCPKPPPRLLVDGFPRRQVVGHVSPRRAGADHPPQSVEYLSEVVIALGCVLPEECQVRGDERPLFVGNVAWVWFSSSHTPMLSFLS